jgi:hypothetical protein
MALSAAAALRLDRVLQTGLTALSRRLAPLAMFSHVYQAEELQRGKAIHVPFVPLEGLASRDWNANNGYEDGDFNVEEIPVTISHRKYQPFSYTSEQLVGLSPAILEQAMVQKADKLASDIITHVMGAITVANYGAHVMEIDGSVFDTNDIIDLDGAMTVQNWPGVGRGLLLDSTFATTAKKDEALKDQSRSGSTQTLREGVIGRVGGFDVAETPGLPENGERLKGFACLPYALLLASAPIEPAPAVKAQLFDYRKVVDKNTGLALVYRHWADPNSDKEKRVIEVCYGFAKGDAAQLKRITRPA